MDTPVRTRRVVCCLIALTIGAAISTTAHADPIWNEIGDAGDLPGTAQVTVGSGPLTEINGRILGFDDGFFGDDIDMFAIFIPDLSAFSATTVGSDIIDSDLFLFDSSGRGVAANGDTSLLLFETNATIPHGSLTGPAGIYFVAVASFPDHPVSPDGDIFPDLLVFAADGEVVGPTGAGGASPVSAWLGDSAGFAPVTAGAYQIQLEGATFAQSSTVIPEPTTFALLAAGSVLALGAHRRRRRTRTVGSSRPRRGFVATASRLRTSLINRRRRSRESAGRGRDRS